MENKSEQYYPTYNFKPENRDVVLLEFQQAQEIAHGQTKVYEQVTNVLLAVTTFIFTFFLGQEKDTNTKAISFILSNSLLFSTILFVFGGMLLRYFVDLQKQITISARKVVTLRTMLGLDYGHIHLTLPNWRVEGATNPFAIRYFNGWLQFKSTPFWLITIFVNAVFYLSIQNISTQHLTSQYNFIGINPLYSIHLFITVVYFYLFRKNLNDLHETVYLNFVKVICYLLRIKLVNNFEYTIYRAKLSYIELDRLKVNYETLSRILVDIEDTSFYHNPGISIKAIFRGLISRFEVFRRKFGYIEHGGSTITMQLTRSLFIISKQNKYLRKISELMLSIWLNRQFTKAEILKLYITSVRYDKGIIGLSNAIKYFFGDVKDKTISNEEAFFLVERLSNITATVKTQRIEHLITRTKVHIDKVQLRTLYKAQIKKGKIICTHKV